MVTFNGSYFGLHDDEKPTDAINGMTYIEMDTGKIYFYDEENATWCEWGGQ